MNQVLVVKVNKCIIYQNYQGLLTISYIYSHNLSIINISAMIRTQKLKNPTLQTKLIPFLNQLYRNHHDYFLQLEKLLQPNLLKQDAFNVYFQINQYLIKNNKKLAAQFNQFFTIIKNTGFNNKKNYKKPVRITDSQHDSYTLRRPEINLNDIERIDCNLKHVINTKWETVQYVSQNFQIEQKNVNQQKIINIQQQIATVQQKIISLKFSIEQLNFIFNNKLINHQFPLIKSLLILFYGIQNPYIQLLKNYKIALVLLPRFQNKLREIQTLKQMWIPGWVKTQQQHFILSLDRRYIDFRQNDLDSNNLLKWDQELFERFDYHKNKIPLAHPLAFCYYNTFGDPIGQYFINSNYQGFPQHSNMAKRLNCVDIFQMQFSQTQIIQDIGYILFQKTAKLNKLPILLLLKIFNIGSKQIKKSAQTKQNLKILFNQYKTKDCSDFNKKNQQNAMIKMNEYSDAYSMRMISDQQAKSNHIVFIGTKQHYMFMRGFLAIYQRFVLAKQLKNEIKQVNFNNHEIYQIFINLLRQRTQEAKFQQCLKKIYGNKAHYLSATYKLINNLVSFINKFDPVSLKLSQAGTQFYQMNIKNKQYTPHCEEYQFAKLITTDDLFFIRFHYYQHVLYLSAFKNPFHPKNCKFSLLPQSDPLNCQILPQFAHLDNHNDKKNKTKKRSEFTVVENKQDTKIILKRQIVDKVRKIRNTNE